MAMELNHANMTGNATPRSVEYQYSSAIIPGLHQALETVLCFVSLFAAHYWSMADSDDGRALSFAFFITIGYVALARYGRLYSIGAIMRPFSRADDILVSLVSAQFFFYSIVISISDGSSITLTASFSAAALAFASMFLWRLAACKALSELSRLGVIGRTMVVLGAGDQSRHFLRWMRQTNPYFITVIGVFDVADEAGGPSVEDMPVLGDLEALIRHARARKIDDVVVAMPWHADQALAETVETLKELPINVYLATDLVGFQLAFRPAVGDARELPMFEVVQRPIAGWSSALKSIEDYTLALLIAVALSPLMAIIAILVRIETPGPILFKQQRLGFNNQVFDVYKFRSMHHNRVPETVVRQATRDDPRVTRVGRVLRATSLDELPQLLNVLNGTMSLVGPRPHALSHNEMYGRAIRGYFARHRVKPGITGWAQVNGLRGETETIDKMEARIRHDIYYAENWSLLFDLRIMVLTALVVFLQKTAY